MQRGAVTLHLVPGTPETGLWCDTCLLPSRYVIPIYVLSEDGPSQIGVVDRCMVDRCDGHQP